MKFNTTWCRKSNKRGDQAMQLCSHTNCIVYAHEFIENKKKIRNMHLKIAIKKLIVFLTFNQNII